MGAGRLTGRADTFAGYRARLVEQLRAQGIRDLAVGTEILVLTWLDRADRSVLLTIPRGDPGNPMTGVFSTRSPDRPNPVGLHRVRVIAVDGLRVRVDHLEVLDGTPVIDVKAVLDEIADR